MSLEWLFWNTVFCAFFGLFFFFRMLHSSLSLLFLWFSVWIGWCNKVFCCLFQNVALITPQVFYQFYSAFSEQVSVSSSFSQWGHFTLLPGPSLRLAQLSSGRVQVANVIWTRLESWMWLVIALKGASLSAAPSDCSSCVTDSRWRTAECEPCSTLP